MPYTPDHTTLERYARLLVTFALQEGQGITPGEVVIVHGSDACKPLYTAVCEAVWRAHGHVIHAYTPAADASTSLERTFFELASDRQLDFLPRTYLRGRVKQADHAIYLLAPADPHALDGIDPARQMRYEQARLPVAEWEQKKENAGRFSWALALYGTPALAREAGMSLEEYWQQIISACFLDHPDPIAQWRATQAQIQAQCKRLNALPIERLHVTGDDADLWLALGRHRIWAEGVGANIPSFEIYTSPDWHGTEGWIRFSEPLYAFGSLIRGVELRFERGRVVHASASHNDQLLQQIVATDGGDRVGEFSLTDTRYSRITKFMAETLYDENVGGPYGNTHIALGDSYQDVYDGDPAELSRKQWEQLGFNHASIHTDIVSTTDRRVTATLRDGGERVIYAEGKFTLDDVKV